MKKVISLIGHAELLLRPFSRKTLSSPPPGRARFFVSCFIVAYLFWQLFLPLSYYFRDDKFDERFAWRMFSAFGINQKACWVDVSLDQTRHDQMQASEKKFHAMLETWRNQLRKNPKAIAPKMLRGHCEKSSWINEILLVRKCPEGWRSERLSGYLRLNCKTGEWSGSLHTP